MSPNKYKIKYKHIGKQTGGNTGTLLTNIIKIILLLPLLPLVLYVLLLSHISKYYIIYLPIILILNQFCLSNLTYIYVYENSAFLIIFVLNFTWFIVIQYIYR